MTLSNYSEPAILIHFAYPFLQVQCENGRGNCHGHLLRLLGFPLCLPAKAPRSATEADESTPAPVPVGEVEEAVGPLWLANLFLDP